MARYIDADKLCEALKSMASVQYPDKQNTILGVVSSIENFPAADVVPKSEVAKEFTCFVGDPHKVDHCPYLDEIEKAKAEVAREIFKEIESMLIRYTFEDGYGEYISTGLEDEFAELKKKYAEEKE